MRTPLIKKPVPSSRAEGRVGRGVPGSDARYTYECGVHELTLARREVVAGEVTAVGRGEAEFAPVVDDPLVWLCYRFGEAIPWGAALYEGSDGPRGKPELPPTVGGPTEGRALLYVTLADAAGPAGHAEHRPPARLHPRTPRAIREQSRVSFDPHARRRALEEFHRRHPSVEVMVAHATTRDPVSTRAGRPTSSVTFPLRWMGSASGRRAPGPAVAMPALHGTDSPTHTRMA